MTAQFLSRMNGSLVSPKPWSYAEEGRKASRLHKAGASANSDMSLGSDNRVKRSGTLRVERTQLMAMLAAVAQP